MFIETLEFTIPMDLYDVFSTLKDGPKENLEFPASVNSYGTTQDANIQVTLRSNKLTFVVDGVSSNASMISKSECKTLKLAVFDVDRTLIAQENAVTMTQTALPTIPYRTKRSHEFSVSDHSNVKFSRTSFSERTPPRTQHRTIPHAQTTPTPSNASLSKSRIDPPVNMVNVKQEPEDPDLIEIEPDPEPDDIVPKKETPYMQIDYSSDVPHTQTSQAALDRLSHPQSSHSQSPGSSSSSFHQNVPHVPDYANPGTSQVHHGDQSADDYLVFQDDNDYGDDNEADYSNDDKDHTSSNRMKPLSEYMWKTTPDMSFVLFPASSTETSESLMRVQQCSANRLYQCEECGKTFTQPWTKKNHVDSVHRNMTFVCVCGKVYRYRRALKRHMKSGGYTIGSLDDEKLFTGLHFTSSEEISNRHTRNPGRERGRISQFHTDYNQFNLMQVTSPHPLNYGSLHCRRPKPTSVSCPNCDKTFTTRRAMMVHKAAVHDRESYVCVCGKGYKYKPGLLYHKQHCPIVHIQNLSASE
ncbi:zinc finger protein 816-like [Haliotis rubra]|uniref:zinc finger protein 816-like n=1 Tax=Haliotis rubra TaxID=36100 RepID=UPI001EE5051B|nr:zinc finger protein 816-like [Haliotis rubra]